MNKHIALLFAVTSFTACGGRGFKDALPTRDTVAVNVPAQSGQALVLGEQSQFMIDSKNLADGINGGVGWVFDLLEDVVAMPPTEQDETHAVWGPSEPKGLERLSYRFTVEKVAENDFTYRLEARAKGETEEDAFVVLLDGTAQPGDDDKGTGTMNAYVGARRGLLPEGEDCQSGIIRVSYDASSEPRMLAVDFEEFLDTCANADGEPADAHYEYTETQDGAGTLDFELLANIHRADEAKPGEETLSIRTRWLATGSGRADVRVVGDEVAADLAGIGSTETSVLVTECWDDLFALTYADTTPDELEATFRAHLGDEASCAFAEASAPDA
jgi:hypothetical protein